MASYRFAARPSWLAGHVLVLAAAVAMVLLGRWQLLVSDRKHFDLQNFGYALQWWAFSIFALVFWVRIVRDRGRGTRVVAARFEPVAAVSPEPVAYRRYVPPDPERSDDPEIARYNAYLASLASDRDDA